MNALKNLSLILLLSLAFTAAATTKAQKSMISTCCFMLPRYASASTSKGGGRKANWITVRNPWQGADSCNHMLFIVRNGEEFPKGLQDRYSKETPNASWRCLPLISPCLTNR